MVESRRITGPHLLLDRPGAAIELEDQDPEVVAARVVEGTARLGWPPSTPVIRRHRGGSTVAIEAPVDALTAAALLFDWAIAPPEGQDEAWELVLEYRDRDRNPRLVELLAIRHSPVFADDDGFTAGLGRHARTWTLDALPDPATLPVHGRIPVVFVTGTNGKTTTTRMLVRIGLAAGFTPGWTNSDGIGVGDHVETTGDWTGPGAARTVLRNPAVDLAVLETARGGLLRRGLVLGEADAAVVTNVSSDHLGEFGIFDLAEMAHAKLGVAYGLRHGGALVFNAGDRWLREAVPEVLQRRPDLRVLRFADAAQDGNLDAWADDRRLYVGGVSVPLAELPATFDGTARHNVENALAAALGAIALGLPVPAAVDGLRAFRPTVEQSRGRMNRFTLPSGATALVDFAHNPDGILRIGRTTASWPATSRSLLLGQAGDRTDEDLAELARAAWSLGPDRVVLKEMPYYLRGRAPGAVTAKLRDGLVAAGCPPERIAGAASELDGARALIDGSTRGELVLLLVHEDVGAVLGLLAERGAAAS